MARPPVTDDYYAILEVTQFATSEAIRESYKRLALRFHPDKNKDDGATANFQRLSIAWETLRDPVKRVDYDRNYVRISKRKREEEAKIASEVKRRREEVDREARAQWDSDGASTELNDDEIQRREKARSWKYDVQLDYLTRLQAWTDRRQVLFRQISENQQLKRRREADLAAVTGEKDSDVKKMFEDAIETSKSIGQKIQDPAATLAKLLEGRQNFINRLREGIEDSRKRMKELFIEFEVGTKKYEDEEAKSRDTRVREALELLGPPGRNPPLFSTIDKKGQVINRWKALSRVRRGVKFSFSLETASEGPWHHCGQWKRVGGDQTCERCDQAAFHLILECAPAKCPCCGLIVCDDCFRDLKLLREYDKWIRSSVDEARDSLFSLELEYRTKLPPKSSCGNFGTNVTFEDF